MPEKLFMAWKHCAMWPWGTGWELLIVAAFTENHNGLKISMLMNITHMRDSAILSFNQKNVKSLFSYLQEEIFPNWPP